MKRKRAPRTTKHEKQYRINRIARMLSTGYTRSQIIRYGTEELGLSERQTETYLKWAREVLIKDWDIDRRAFTAELMSQLSSLAMECRKNSNQAHVVLGAINTMARIGHVLEK